MLNAIIAMIGYYIVILAAAMLLIVIGIQIFKGLTARKQQAGLPETSPSGELSGESEEELAAATIAAVSVLLISEPTTVSTWPLVERSPYSPWKTASRSRRTSPTGG